MPIWEDYVAFARSRAETLALKPTGSKSSSWHGTRALCTCSVSLDYKEATEDGVSLLPPPFPEGEELDFIHLLKA